MHTSGHPAIIIEADENNNGKKYPQELRVFALTLHFYSSTAYNYVRKTFAMSLPHPKILQKWYQAVDGQRV